MNNWENHNPEEISQLVKDSLLKAAELEAKLNDLNCPRLSDLYLKEEGKNRFRQVKLFNELRYEANNENEFKGLYVFAKEIEGIITPVYVGRSRTVFRRLRQHGWGKEHNECTLAYRFAKREYHKNNIKVKRKDVTQKELEFGREMVQNFKVALIPVPKDYDLYLLEVLLAGYWKTKWNSFRTH
ncbi:MAG: hypothetical protein ACPGVH_01800 [Chitinophagales bacterium]